MAQGNRRDEKMRSDRGEWDRKRTGFGNTDKRKKNRRSRPSGRERRAVKKYRLIRSGVLLLFLLTVVLLLRSCIRKSQRNRQYVIRLRNGQRGCVRAGD